MAAIDPREVSSALSDNGPGREATQAVAFDPFTSSTADGASEEESGVQYTFRIFRDWRGQYRWVLNDTLGQRLQTSQFAFPALAGAFRDVEAKRANAPFREASVRDDSGR